MMLALSVSYANAQTSKAFFDNIIKNEDEEQKAPIELPHVERADMIWYKTVWRELILKEKMNLPLYYPTVPMDGRISLIDLMLEGIEKSFKTAYEDDELTTPISYAQIKEEIRRNGRHPYPQEQRNGRNGKNHRERRNAYRRSEAFAGERIVVFQQKDFPPGGAYHRPVSDP